MSPPTSSEIRSFMEALRRGDVERVAQELERLPELVNTRDPGSFGAIPLRHAVDRGDRALVDVLLAAGADINAKRDWWAGGFGVLPCDDLRLGEYLVSRGARVDACAAAGMGWTERLAEILKRDPGQANMKGGDGQRPLHQARTVEAIDLLVGHGAELDARDVDHGSTPAQYLIRATELCRRLIEHGAAPDIYIACKLGDAAMAERVLARDPDALGARIGTSPFVSEGSEGGHIYVYRLGYTTRPLALAARDGHDRLLERLLERAAPSQKLVFRCWQADESAVRNLLAEHPGIVERLSPDDLATLPDAAWERRTHAVRIMLDAGFDVDARGSERATALDRACFHGFTDVVALLLARGASLDVVNRWGGTPLGCCVYGSVHGWRTDGDHPATVEALIRAGAVPDASRVPCGNDAVDAVLRRHLP